MPTTPDFRGNRSHRGVQRAKSSRSEGDRYILRETAQVGAFESSDLEAHQIRSELQNSQHLSYSGAV